MSLTNDIIAQFVKATKDANTSKKETTIFYGTTVTHKGKTYVKLDGSELLTPISTTVDTKPDERVTVMIKNHTATITGNISSPSARTGDVENIQMDTEEVGKKISEFEIIVADKVDTTQLNAVSARIDTVVADNVLINNKLEAQEAEFDTLRADNVTINETLTANTADIENLQVNKLDVTIANATYATIAELDATNVQVHNLEGTYADFASATISRLDAMDAEIDQLAVGDLSATYANIDFSNINTAAIEKIFAGTGLIQDIIVGNGTITGKLIGVTISGDLIEGNTVKAEKLVIKGSDGLYYKLNTDGMTTEAQQTDENSLNGSVIKAKSITATKISVSDLVAFGATIGGFHISDSSIYSGAKTTVGNTTRGIYLDKDGQMALGDSSNFLKYYKDTDGNYKLAISADSIIFSSSNKSVEQAVADNIQIGGRNLFRNSKTCTGWVHNDIVTFEPAEADGFTIINFGDEDAATYNRVSPIPNVPYSVVRNKTITISLYVRADENKMDSAYYNSISCSVGIATSSTGNRTKYKDYWLKDADGYYALTTEWQKRSLTLNITDDIFASGTGEITDDSYFVVSFYRYNLAGAQLKAPKLEIGNKPTDWTPAPEDMATADDATRAQNLADAAQQTANNAESLIRQLSDNISMLVTDGNGTSLMTQTENGWMFSTAELQSVVNSTSQGLDALSNALDSTSNTVDVLKQAVEDLGIISEYVKITTYEDEPCIELGEGDSDFKLIITNTRILFMEGSGVPAYINNQSLYIRKAVVEEELHQGKFVWKARANGNLGLVWKGVTS